MCVLQIITYNEVDKLVWPEGNVTVAGADNGLTYGLYLNKTAPQQMFDPTLFRAIDIDFAGAHLRTPPFCGVLKQPGSS